MSLAIEGASVWRASVEHANPIRAADPLGSGASLSPWQALMASAALAPGGACRQNVGPGADGAAGSLVLGACAPGGEAGGWRARIEPNPALNRPSSPQPPPVMDDPERIETAEARPPKPDAPNPEPPGLFENGDFSLADLLDIVNPLQHIPIVSTIYRELTGDRIGHGARLAGGVLFLGPLGGLSALANVIMLEASGKDIGDHALALFKDDPASATTLAANAVPPPGAQAPNTEDPAASFAPGLSSGRHAPPGGHKTESASAPAPIADEKALAELLPPGAIPLSGRSVDFTQAALRPAALAPAPSPAAADDDLPPPPPPRPIAGPGWKGFYSPPEIPAAPARAVPTQGAPQSEPLLARRAYAPDPMAALAAKRTPGAMAGALAVPPSAPGALAVEGGWFSDVMLEALGKYEDARRLRGQQAPEAARRGAVNIVN